MKKLVTILAIALCSTLAMAQTNQYFWAGGQFIMGNPIGQIDSVTFGELEQTDSVLLYLPRTVKVIHDTVIQYVTIHDTINPCAVPEGAISGKFSVSDTKQVYFSQGNLQYQASSNSWRFAENQYDYIGADNSNISPTYNGWIDLFGWGTGDNPTLKTTYNKDYNSFVDWGINLDEWRTLQKNEWNYLLMERTNASSLWTYASIDGIEGLLILPDNGEFPSYLTIVPQSTQFNINSLSMLEWTILNKEGALFLPASGDRNGNIIYNLKTDGGYWSSTLVSIDEASCVAINEKDGIRANYAGHLYVGRSVRLVQDVK